MNPLEKVCQKLINKEIINYDDIFDDFREDPSKKMYYENTEIRNNPTSLSGPIIDADLCEIVSLVYLASLQVLIENTNISACVLEIEKRKNTEALMQYLFINGEKVFLYQNKLHTLINDSNLGYAVENMNATVNNQTITRHLRYFIQSIDEEKKDKILLKLVDNHFYTHQNKKLTFIHTRVESYLEKINLEHRLTIDEKLINNDDIKRKTLKI